MPVFNEKTVYQINIILSNLANMDTEQARESVHNNRVSIASGLNLEKM